jgi:ATP-dependent exoDNAse (exonuclease V) alpha subunit
MPFVAAGGEYKFFGRFVNHAKHGEQFEIAKYEILPPDDEQKIAAFIGGGLIFGVGPATAKKIVKKFGRETLNVLASAPEKLSAVRGISPAKARRIGAGYGEISAMPIAGMSYLCAHCTTGFFLYCSNCQPCGSTRSSNLSRSNVEKVQSTPLTSPALSFSKDKVMGTNKAVSVLGFSQK